MSPETARSETREHSLPHLRVERPSDGVARLVLDNPDQRNAMSDQMTDSWVRAVDELAADRSVRVVVVTGEGTRLLLGRQHRLDRQRAGRRGRLPAHPDDRPSTAPGSPSGSSRCPPSRRSTARRSAPACAWPWPATSGTPPQGARLGAPFVKLGMNPGMAATYLLPNAVGEANARELLLTGRTVDAEEARQLGLVSRVFPADELRRVRSTRSPRASRPRRRSRAATPSSPCATVATRTSSRACSGRRSPSRSRWPPPTCRRASAAAREKRPPEFRGV